MKIAICKRRVRGRLADLWMPKASLLLKGFHIRLSTVMAVAFAFSIPTLAQSIDSPELRLGTILGTVTDVNGNIVPGARVVLQGPDTHDCRTLTTSGNGFFQFNRIEPGIPYEINVTATGMEEWTSSSVTLEPNKAKILNAQLRIPVEQTTVKVNYDPVEVATQQVRSEEQQRVLGFIPNFYVVYDPNPEPLTTKLKFELALKVSKRSGNFCRGRLYGRREAGSRYSQLQARRAGVRQAAFRNRGRRSSGHHDWWRDPAVFIAPGPALLLSRNRYDWLSRSPCDVQSVCRQGRQRKLAAELLERRRRFGNVRHLGPLLSRVKPRRWARVLEFCHRYG